MDSANGSVKASQYQSLPAGGSQDTDVVNDSQETTNEPPSTSQNNDGEMEDPDKLLIYGSKQIIRLFIPVSVCMLFVVAIISSLTYYSTTEVYLPYTPFHDDNAQTGTVVWQSIVNALIILALVIVMTIVLILLYKFRCYKIIQIWLYVTSALILFLFSLIFFAVILSAANIPFDYLTLAVCIWNFGIVGQIVVHWKGPLLVQQMYLIFISALMALVFIKYLPEWTAWVLLVLISIWDLVAVLCPKGPLRMLVETAQERNEPIFPSLIYSTTAAYIVVNQAGDTQEVDNANSQPASPDSSAHHAAAATLNGSPHANDASPGRNPDDSSRFHQAFQDESHGVKLGLGDFVFYSILVGRASAKGDWNTTLACYFAILIGLSLTLLLLAIGRRALPALPISITFGVIFYFLTSIIVSPFVDALTGKQLFM